MPIRYASLFLAVLSLAMLGLGLFLLETARTGVSRTQLELGGVPVTQYRSGEASGPAVIVAHGFAASRTMMEAFSLSLASAGYRVFALDFPGHGENREFLSPDISAIDGTTRQLVSTVRSVVDGVAAGGDDGRPIALIGHSMATDVIIRLARQDSRIGPLIAVAYYSEVVTDRFPKDLLIVTGEFETRLREPALAALRQVNPKAEEGETVTNDAIGIRRSAIVAPFVEHVGVLYSTTSLQASLDWLNEYYGHEGAYVPVPVGLGLVLTLGGAFLFALPLSKLLPGPDASMRLPKARNFWWVLLLPPVVTPLLLAYFRADFVPMMAMSYLTAHVLLYGALTLLLLRRGGIGATWNGIGPALSLLLYTVLVFGVLLDRYFSDFIPSPDRLPGMVLIAVGAVPFMLADSLFLKAAEVPWWTRFASRLLFVGSLAAAIALAPENRWILGFFLPVLVLYYLVFGTMARWLQARCNAPASLGIAQGVLLAYSLASAVPLVGTP